MKFPARAYQERRAEYDVDISIAGDGNFKLEVVKVYERTKRKSCIVRLAMSRREARRMAKEILAQGGDDGPYG